MLYSFPEAVKRLENLPESAQRLLHDAILEILYRKKPAACFTGRDEDVAALESAGLAVNVEAPEVAIGSLGRNELVKRLTSAGVSGFKKNASLEALVEWSGNSPDVDHFTLAPEVSVVVLAPEVERVRKKIYLYLGRKYENESYYDPDADAFIEYPKGASFVTEIHPIEGGSSLMCAFPDDEITALLEKYGCNRCHTWRKP